MQTSNIRGMIFSRAHSGGVPPLRARQSVSRWLISTVTTSPQTPSFRTWWAIRKLNLVRELVERNEIYGAPRSWAERNYHKLIYFHEVDKGGHFAAWEQPGLFSNEIRMAFRSLREWRVGIR